MHENKFTPRAEEALRLAQEAAEEMGHGYVGTEHLLLGLLREEEGIAHRALTECGLTDELVCTIVQRSVGTGLSGAAPSQGLTPRAGHSTPPNFFKHQCGRGKTRCRGAS